MRRVVSLWLPNFATDRLRGFGAAPPDAGRPDGRSVRAQGWCGGCAQKQDHAGRPDGRAAYAQGSHESGPLITVVHDGRRLVLAAVDAAAAASGLYPGMALARARAMAPDLMVHPATPEADAAALRRLAGWCLRYAPLVAVDPPDGIWIDVTGGAHLFGGERHLLDDLLRRLAAQGLTATAAIADTPGAAWAMARFGGDPAGAATADQCLPSVMASPRPSAMTGGARGKAGAMPPVANAIIIPPGIPLGVLTEALAPLPVQALRLPEATVEGLRLMGFEQIGPLIRTPRAPLVRRFGALLATRLDQALGRVFEPIVPLVPAELIQARLAFAEPLLTPQSLSAVIARLTQDVCVELAKAGLGARRLDLLFERIDGAIPVIRIGTARPSRDPRHIARMLDERLERIDPGLGVEAMRLVVPRADALAYEQTRAHLTETEAPGKDIAPLVDRLVNRLGADRVYRVEAVESDVPERSVRRLAPLPAPLDTRPLDTRRLDTCRLDTCRLDTCWPTEWPRPIRLLDPPQPVEAMALLPDHPPVTFSWRRVRHRVRHADGPERIAGEWWKRDGEMHSVRDYFRVEDEKGRRFWLFRRGDGEDATTGDMRWFLHGFF